MIQINLFVAFQVAAAAITLVVALHASSPASNSPSLKTDSDAPLAHEAPQTGSSSTHTGNDHVSTEPSTSHDPKEQRRENFDYKKRKPEGLSSFETEPKALYLWTGFSSYPNRDPSYVSIRQGELYGRNQPLSNLALKNQPAPAPVPRAGRIIAVGNKEPTSASVGKQGVQPERRNTYPGDLQEEKERKKKEIERKKKEIERQKKASEKAQPIYRLRRIPSDIAILGMADSLNILPVGDSEEARRKEWARRMYYAFGQFE